MLLIGELYANSKIKMKNSTIKSGLFLFVLISTQQLQAQQVCLVSSDYLDGERYIVVWEKPADLTGLDSVYIYRKAGVESIFSKVGAQDINDSSYFKDMTSNTIDTTKYAITFLTNSGIESTLSPWHQGVVLDYFSGGNLVWTKYKKQNQIDESYISGYEMMVDQTALGAYTSVGLFLNNITVWNDVAAAINPLSTYYVETYLPTCNITKANINTSRSNIKQQFSNSEAGIIEADKEILIQISPNPTSKLINVSLDDSFIGAEYSINDASGKILFNGNVKSKTFSLDLSEIQNGTYFINFDKKGRVVTKIFIKN